VLSKGPESGDFPAYIIANVTRLVNCPRSMIDAEVSTDGSVHLLLSGPFPGLFPDLCALYDDSSRFDHLDRGEIPTNWDNSAVYIGLLINHNLLKPPPIVSYRGISGVG